MRFSRGGQTTKPAAAALAEGRAAAALGNLEKSLRNLIFPIFVRSGTNFTQHEFRRWNLGIRLLPNRARARPG